MKCYIICAFITGFPKAIPTSNGTQGAAKTTKMEFEKMLIDPCIAKTFSFPRNINELNQQLSHYYVTYYDNISEIKDWISDELCRAVSGSGSSRRRLYTDEDDLIRSLMRCIGLNGINLAATRADLLDRAIFFKLKRIPEENRRYIVELQKQFEEMLPQVLGYIMDILVKVLKWKENNKLEVSKIPRMADWAGHCEIIARCMGYKPEEFLNAYRENAKIQTEEIMQTSLVATCIAHFVDTDPRFNGKAMVKDLDGRPVWGWVGIASSLKSELEQIAAELNIDIKSRGWPRNPAWLVKRLNEIIHTLKDAGIEIAYDHVSASKKNIKIRKLPSLPSLPSQTQIHAQNTPKNCDGNNDGKNTIVILPSQTGGKAEHEIDSKTANYGNYGNYGNLHTLKESPTICPECNKPVDPDPFYGKLHQCGGTGK